MGIHCEINLFKPSDGAFVPGGAVSGVVRYAVDEDTTFNTITMSLKGSGYFLVKDKLKKKRNQFDTFRNRETYVDIDNLIQSDEKGTVTTIGSYEIPFNFTLPDNAPMSLTYRLRNHRYIIRCYISYYVRIKFERPGFLSFAKRFKKDITVVSGSVTPRLSMVPVIYGEEKKLFHLFSRKKSIVNIKATLQNSVISPGNNIEINHEVENSSSVVVKAVESKLIEVYTFTAPSGREIKIPNEVQNSDSKTGTIQSGETKSMDLQINVASELNSLENSNIVKRDYFVKINVVLPFPHTDLTLEIPVQIGMIREPILNDFNEPPPSYWEAMHEESDEKKEDIDDENDD